MEKPDKRRKYDAAFRAEALRVVTESRRIDVRISCAHSTKHT